MKLREIREAYEVLSGTFSKTSRTLALSGIAIAWFFMPYFKGYNKMLVFNVLAICAFVLVLLGDLLQNYILSKKWYSYYTKMKDIHHKDEEDDIKEPEDDNKIGWLLYDCKFWVLLTGYVLLAICFIILLLGHLKELQPINV